MFKNCRNREPPEVIYMNVKPLLTAAARDVKESEYYLPCLLFSEYIKFLKSLKRSNYLNLTERKK